MTINDDITEVYFKGTPKAIEEIIEWWKWKSKQEFGKDIIIIDCKPNLYNESKV